MHRFHEGKVYRTAEVCSKAFEEFWDATGLEE